MDFLQKVRSGDRFRIPAEAYNAFVDAALDTRRRPGRPIGGIIPAPSKSSTLVKVQNKTGIALDQYSVVSLGDPVISHSDNSNEFLQNWAIKVNQPLAPTAAQTVAILRDPLRVDGIGQAAVVGLTPVQVSVGSDTESFTRVKTVDGQTGYCEMAAKGGFAKIVTRETGVGLKWAIVLLDLQDDRTGWNWTSITHLDAPNGPNYRIAVGEAVQCDISGGNAFFDLPEDPADNDSVMICLFPNGSFYSGWVFTTDAARINGGANGPTTGDFMALGGSIGNAVRWKFEYSAESGSWWTSLPLNTGT